MNIAIALLSALVLHLTLLFFVFSIDIKGLYPLIKLVVPIHFLPIFLCLITSLAYLYEVELALFHLLSIRYIDTIIDNMPKQLLSISLLSIKYIDIIINNMPKYLLSISLILSIICLRKCWIFIFGYFDVFFENNENE